MDRWFALIGSIFALLAVAAGAVGAHMLKEHLSEHELSIFNLAAQYQMYHALALWAVAFAITKWPLATPVFATAGWLFVLGTICFSGSLYVRALGGPDQLTALTAIGGATFILGWILLTWAVAHNIAKKSESSSTQ